VVILLIAAAVLLPTVAILHATETSSNATSSHDSDNHDQNHQEQDHDDNETSDDNTVMHADLEDANENETD
jgi:ADP-heptose:LPS heptosyltransferase